MLILTVSLFFIQNMLKACAKSLIYRKKCHATSYAFFIYVLPFLKGNQNKNYDENCDFMRDDFMTYFSFFMPKPSAAKFNLNPTDIDLHMKGFFIWSKF